MLDDLKMIHDRDTLDVLGAAEKQWQQLQQTYDVMLPDFGGMTSIVVAAMGGSALSAVFVRSWPGTSVPLEVVRDYELPAYVDSHTLFIAASYSGNTEETLAALAEAERRQARIVVITAGGKLAERAMEMQYPLYTIPASRHPRLCTFYFVSALVEVLEAAGLAPSGSKHELAEAGEWLGGQATVWRPDVATRKNAAKQLAQELMGRSVVIYSGPKLFPAASRWKINCNENAKQIAWVNQFPELNHNEFTGWSGHPTDKPYALIQFRSALEHPRVQKRLTVTDKLLSGRWPTPLIVDIMGQSVVKQLLWTSLYGDFVTVYLAILNGVDPSSLELVDKFKKEMDN